MLRIGRIDYANVTPLFRGLTTCFPCEGYQIVSGVPAVLNSMLAAGEIDVCPSSSFAYAVNAERYLILPELSISSAGPVASVLLFSRVPLEELDGRTVLLSAESATSVNLLKILMSKRFGCRCTFRVSDSGIVAALEEAPAMLLIGDAALRSSQVGPAPYVYDLGSLWYDWTGLPFVFALWFCTRTAAAEHRQEMATLAGQLLVAKEYACRERERIAAQAEEASWMGRERLIAYWRDNISYNLGKKELDGLRLFYAYGAELGLLSAEPDLVLFS
ncbi:menaquinone biosynthetic enzyme MqnA/MqnD family protein [Trichlorobacter ammonificans]|uniref:Chorismate dehydratase n=1 Tax=Trichlorobacter ammonificans TaxID=2916410 RepID=A0ABM9DAC9_9BACT|nr:menaquinone biosynthesis protein [Trichlorobacter ammonificans]CAH2032156.1 Chorismate dehydratase [Trichlorobacter ammonificans]